jgi:hypothetical protein
MVLGRPQKVPAKDQDDPKTTTPIYKAVVQAVLLYGAESWVLTGAMEKIKASTENVQLGNTFDQT